MSIEPVAKTVNSHAYRAASYFCSSLQFLKSQRGGQAWNEIATDVVEVYKHSSLVVKPVSYEKLWFYLFDAPTQDGVWFFEIVKIFQEYPDVQDFFCQVLLYTMTDPRKEWWESLKT